MSLDEFKLGRLLRHPSPGCPDGHLQLSEGEAGEEPPPGSGTGAGFFCGNIGNRTRQDSSVTTCNISIPLDPREDIPDQAQSPVLHFLCQLSGESILLNSDIQVVSAAGLDTPFSKNCTTQHYNLSAVFGFKGETNRHNLFKCQILNFEI